ncbi:MAG: NADH-quinone oxidoreductase subunit L [Balneolales bacterium]|nr:NADH-quinone oxidoreductase subunit L [Balneolales bacterium]
MAEYVWLIIAIPLAGFLINGLLGLSSESYRKQKSVIGWLATVAVFIPFLISVLIFLEMNAGSEPTVVRLFTWIEAGSFTSDIAYRVDQLSILMALVVTGVGFLIHVYSMGYMKDDEGYWKFFTYLNMFIFAMLNLVMANNLVLLFLGWEGVGVCSYLLIGFWYGDMEKASAAKKAFIYNRVGDFAFLIAMFLVFRAVGSLDFDVIFSNMAAFSPDIAFWVCVLMFIGATGKSAQIPLFVWLPDAMAGPTPVSALIHAATMVTSGIYLITRFSGLYMGSPEAMLLVAVIGGLTAIVAATIALTQYDIKKVLAYSTVSQLGFMFLALGSGGYVAAMFHVITHAFFKACLFLGSGSVIHAMHHVEHELEHEGKDAHFDPQDMRNMGGLREYMPSTYKTFLISTFAIAGIPFFSGFFSKDEILAYLFNAGLGEYGAIYFGLWGLAVITAFLTAFYMFRLTLTTFHGTFKLPGKVKGAEDSAKYLHESPVSMTAPLWVLAGLAIVGGFMGIPEFFVTTFTSTDATINWLYSWLSGVTTRAEIILPYGIKWTLVAFAILVAVSATIFAYKKYDNDKGEETDAAIRARFGGLYTTWEEKYLFDEAYEKSIIKPGHRFSDRVLAIFDIKIIDGFVNLIGSVVQFFGSLLRFVQTGVIHTYAIAFLIGVILIIGLLIF